MGSLERVSSAVCSLGGQYHFGALVKPRSHTQMPSIELPHRMPSTELPTGGEEIGTSDWPISGVNLDVDYLKEHGAAKAACTDVT